MKKGILSPSALVMLVWTYSLTEAKAPIIPRTALSALSPDCYEVIITNNLFRPLGWTKPKPPSAFGLTVTVIMPNESSAWTARAIQIPKHKALIRNTRNR